VALANSNLLETGNRNRREGRGEEITVVLGEEYNEEIKSVYLTSY
jgi:hypothetical protein